MSSDVRDKLREVAPRPSSRVDVDRAWRRGLELRRRRRWALASACVALVVIGVGVATRLPSLTGRAVDRNTRPVAPPLSDAPTVATIVCDKNGTRALTSRVRPQPDGVHITIYNRSRARSFYMRAFENPDDNHGGPLDHGENRVVASFPPGDMLVGCFSGSRGPYSYYKTDLKEYVRVTIVDPHGLWRPSDLACAEPINAGVVRDGRATGDLVASDDEVERLARSVPGIRPTDVLQRPGYPETPYHAEPRDVIRDGRAVASLDVFQEFGSWKIAVRACPGSGIGPKKGAPAPAPPSRVCRSTKSQRCASSSHPPRKAKRCRRWFTSEFARFCRQVATRPSMSRWTGSRISSPAS